MQALPTIGDRVVLAAMDELTLRINMATGILHPSDRQATVEMFRTLMELSCHALFISASSAGCSWLT